MPQITRELVDAGAKAIGGTGTLAELCFSVGAMTSHDKEIVFKIISRHYKKIPISELDREYFTYNKGKIKWAYQLVESPDCSPTRK